ncbi:hypothetical protein BJY00DRAFT_297157 [Aspergillus carlsbadensis]|nr:hypothetical protein BJY00DRAFT_297157 [Aspergillus carlsbadensis]
MQLRGIISNVTEIQHYRTIIKMKDNSANAVNTGGAMEFPAPSSPACTVSTGGRSVPEAVGNESESNESEEVSGNSNCDESGELSGKDEKVSSSDGGSSVGRVVVMVVVVGLVVLRLVVVVLVLLTVVVVLVGIESRSGVCDAAARILEVRLA